MLHTKIRQRFGAGLAVAALLGIVPAAASAQPSSSKTTAPEATTSALAAAVASCTPPSLTQSFLPFGDDSEYALVPGESYDNLFGSGWTLTGRAHIVSATLYDGTQGSVLDLPAGSSAISPPTCVTNQDPTVRTMVQDLAGSAGVNLVVGYLSGNGLSFSTGNIQGAAGGWSVSPIINIHPSSVSGWQLAQFVFTPNGNSPSEYRIYNFYIDPRIVG
jgi:hypothetical protein